MYVYNKRYNCPSLGKLYDDMIDDQAVNSITYRTDSFGNSVSSSLSDDYVCPLTSTDASAYFERDYQHVSSQLQGSIVYGLLQYHLVQPKSPAIAADKNIDILAPLIAV